MAEQCRVIEIDDKTGLIINNTLFVSEYEAREYLYHIKQKLISENHTKVPNEDVINHASSLHMNNVHYQLMSIIDQE